MGIFIENDKVNISKYLSRPLEYIKSSEREVKFSESIFCSVDIVSSAMSSGRKLSDFERLLRLVLDLPNAVMEILTPEQFLERYEIQNISFADYLRQYSKDNISVFLSSINRKETVFVVCLNIVGVDEYLLFDDTAAKHDSNGNYVHKFVQLNTDLLRVPHEISLTERIRNL